tara:strand:- start:547 stop:759 length:213 start_codon:yes stop_codon:yes gene_type:complete
MDHQKSAELAGRALGNFLRGVKQSGIIKTTLTVVEHFMRNRVLRCMGIRRCLMTRRGTRMLCRTAALEDI